ncbi:CoA-binding protein [Candidatus Marinimicrobia bacterium MT.SAG.3]|nr:CoA-binding protein [Candidatus Marinimicrobia bacterium MT.SAG.3]
MNLSKYQNESVIRRLLNESKTIAVYGASNKIWRTSHNICKFLLEVGYEMIPVNPKYDEVLGVKCYPTLSDIETQIDIVDVFRHPSEVIPIAEEAVQIGAKSIWFQESVINEAAAEIASSCGLDVIMDRCILKEYNFLIN